MKIVNNFAEIKNHLSFNNKNEFYVVQIVQRKKDGNEGLHVRHGYRLIKAYYIYSIQELEELMDRIINLCEDNNARAYINMNVRNAVEVALECAQRYIKLVADNNAFMGKDVYERVCGSSRAKGYKSRWVIDVDDPSIENLEHIKELILSCRHNQDFEMFSIPTVNGFHIISNGFDVKQFHSMTADEGLDYIDIHKNNPTLLYYNDISSKSKQESIQS